MHKAVKRLLASQPVNAAESRDLSRGEFQIRHLEVLRANSHERLVPDREPAHRSPASFPAQEIAAERGELSPSLIS